DVTGETFGDYNGAISISGSESAPVSIHPDPGALWVRVMRVGSAYVVHLINLLGQGDANWDAPKQPIAPVGGLRLRVERIQKELPTWYFANPDEPGQMRCLEPQAEGNFATCELPAIGAWALVYLPGSENIREFPENTRAFPENTRAQHWRPGRCGPTGSDA
ncbi:MAG: hypothetical protein LBU38_00970, partial [Propionibacteriaceae bacterium]|nr:hypothetical protein [Propionibacteriaceae bacterium]